MSVEEDDALIAEVERRLGIGNYAAQYARREKATYRRISATARHNLRVALVNAEWRFVPRFDEDQPTSV